MERKELQKELDKLLSQVFGLLDNSPFVQSLDRLCNASSCYGVSSMRAEMYEEKGAPDKALLAAYEDDVLQAKFDFYTEFLGFVKKYSRS